MIHLSARRYACAILLLIVLGSRAADASNWLECEGSATVKEALRGEDGIWQLSATSEAATVTDGFGAAGENCAEATGDIVISGAEEIAAGQMIRFKYAYYGALGPQGPVTSRTWKHIP